MFIEFSYDFLQDSEIIALIAFGNQFQLSQNYIVLKILGPLLWINQILFNFVDAFWKLCIVDKERCATIEILSIQKILSKDEIEVRSDHIILIIINLILEFDNIFKSFNFIPYFNQINFIAWTVNLRRKFLLVDHHNFVMIEKFAYLCQFADCNVTLKKLISVVIVMQIHFGADNRRRRCH